MPAVVLATLNARYHHCSFGLRYLLANMGTLQEQTELVEFTINQPTLEILDTILSLHPRIVGLGVYIWNVDETLRLVSDLKRVAPDVIVVLGGPEVSYEVDEQPICQLADYVVTGEADLAFPALCRQLLSAKPEENSITSSLTILHSVDSKPAFSKVVHAAVPDLKDLILPYDLYSDQDIANRVIYVEASRGCPFTCEFCLSALDIPVRQFALDPFLSAMERLLERGVRIFKFVDRTFNLNLRTSRAIMEFFLKRYRPGLFLHFELIPDRLPEGLKEIIVQFPPGALQFEVGIQTFNDDVSELISRRQDNGLVDQNLTWLRDHTSVHVHADLIVGLPGESLESFAAGFDRLVKLAPHEIQVGILKRLRGTPIVRHDVEWQMVYSSHPPYEILRTRLLDFSTVQELRRFAKFWDTIANSGNFVDAISLIFNHSPSQATSAFEEFRRLSNWLYQREGHSHGISLTRLVELMFEFLTQVLRLSSEEVARVLWRDYQRGGRSDKPACLRPFLVTNGDILESEHHHALTRNPAPPKRQGRRLGIVKES